jgi:hypothetical protein
LPGEEIGSPFSSSVSPGALGGIGSHCEMGGGKGLGWSWECWPVIVTWEGERDWGGAGRVGGHCELGGGKGLG